MIRKILSLFLTFFSLTCLAQSLTRKQAQADLMTLQENLESYHAGFYRYTTPDSMAYYFQQSQNRLKENMNVIDLYKEVTFLLNKVRCGHTRPSLPAAVNQQFTQEQLFLPLSVEYLGERLFVKDFLTNDGQLQKGDEILSINGKPVKEITRKIFEHHSSDGYVNTGKYRLTALYFRYYYRLYVDEEAQRYQLTLQKPGGEKRSVTLTGESWQNLQRLNQPKPESAALELDHRTGYSYMRIGTFVNSYLRNANLDYEEFLEESFKELKERGTKKLVLDLRGNGGGTDDYGALLVSYFADRPFKYFERIEVTDDYSGYGSVERKGGRNLMTSHKGLSTWQPKKDRFQGEVYVLTDGWSFSTCADVATVLHHNGWAKFVGEETGGGYDGNTSGNSRTLTLSNSGIRVNLPMWMYTTANLGHKFKGRGVIPDHKVVPTVQQFIDGEDAVLNFTIEELIK